MAGEIKLMGKLTRAAGPVVDGTSVGIGSDAADRLVNTNGVINALGGMSYLTEAPTSTNTSGGLILVYLTSEPATKYDGYIYFIAEE